MKSCPTCKKTFADDTLSFCLEDGTPLDSVSAAANDPEATIVSSDSEVTVISPQRREPQPAQPAAPRQQQPTIAAPQFSTPYAQSYAAPPKQRSALPWILGLVAVGVLLIVGIVVVIAVIPMVLNSNKQTNNRPTPTPRRDGNATPTPKSTPSDNESDVPTDPDEVSAQLKKLEREWTEANIKGDKDALERILADDYVGGEDSHTKQEYLDKLEAETDVESWDLQKLTVEQNGKRATVHGFLIQETSNGTERYEFTDQFVWRDHRWQATGSETTRVK